MQSPARRGLYLAALIAFSIGLHNLGEGLAIGAAFALGEAALGSFLVIGFTLHNITEGVGIAAPLVPGKKDGRRAGGWSTGPSVPDLPGTGAAGRLAGDRGRLDRRLCLFAAAGEHLPGHGRRRDLAGARRSHRLLKGYADHDGASLFSWVNVGGFLAGLAIMYSTALLVN